AVTYRQSSSSTRFDTEGTAGCTLVIRKFHRFSSEVLSDVVTIPLGSIREDVRANTPRGGPQRGSAVGLPTSWVTLYGKDIRKEWPGGRRPPHDVHDRPDHPTRVYFADADL